MRPLYQCTPYANALFLSQSIFSLSMPFFYKCAPYANAPLMPMRPLCQCAPNANTPLMPMCPFCQCTLSLSKHYLSQRPPFINASLRSLRYFLNAFSLSLCPISQPHLLSLSLSLSLCSLTLNTLLSQHTLSLIPPSHIIDTPTFTMKCLRNRLD